ncbi:LuxR C-terminal-related transcriptional regulator [Nocardioides sp. GCM10027113]|uniref:LuxR C-terminal-related transcriptional regulator n=1 Tax=unclassified Nocardioides TaxID=2615069 RepID=UPI003620A815
MSQQTLARSSVRILIIEDHTLFAESLELALSMEGYDVRRLPVQENHLTQGALLSSVVRLHPRIVLLDLDLGHLGDGVRLIAPIARSGAHVVVVTASPEKGRWGECLRYGARKVLSKARPLNEIMATVRRLNQGLPVMDREEREDLLQAWHRERQHQQELRTRLQRLTNREREVLGHLTEGHTVRDIARISVVSEATVRTQVKSILAKLEVSSQLAAVGVAHAVGWRPPGP